MTTTQIVVLILLAVPYTMGLVLLFGMVRRTRTRLIAARNAQRELRRDAVAAGQKLRGMLEKHHGGIPHTRS